MAEVPVISVKDATGIAHDVATISALIAIVGSADATPATNTLLARLKDLKTSMDAGNALLTTQATFVDGLETLIGATNTQLTAIAGFVDGLESKSDATNALLTTQAGYLDGLETLIGTTNASLTLLAGYTDGVETLLGTANTALAALVARTTQTVDQISSAYGATATFSRPADTVAYTAGDVVGGPLTFLAIGPTAGVIILNGASFEYDVAAMPSGLANLRLHLYTATPPSALADNAAFSLPSGDRSSYHGFIDLGAPAALGGTVYGEVNNVGKQIKIAAGATALYGYLQTTAAFTPTSGDGFVVKLRSVAV